MMFIFDDVITDDLLDFVAGLMPVYQPLHLSETNIGHTEEAILLGLPISLVILSAARLSPTPRYRSLPMGASISSSGTTFSWLQDVHACAWRSYTMSPQLISYGQNRSMDLVTPELLAVCISIIIMLNLWIRYEHNSKIQTIPNNVQQSILIC